MLLINTSDHELHKKSALKLKPLEFRDTITQLKVNLKSDTKINKSFLLN